MSLASSSFPPGHFVPANDHNTSPCPYDYDDPYYPSPQSALTNESTNQYYDAALFTQAWALLQQPTQHTCMNNFTDFYASHPNIRVQQSTPTPAAAATRPRDTYSAELAATVPTQYSIAHNWPMYQSMGGPAVSNAPASLKRGRSHQRTPSASTIGSNGPASPYAKNYSNPHIVNLDFAPHSPALYADQASAFSKNLPTPTQTPTDSGFMSATYTPSAAAHTGGAHDAMKGFAIDHHIRDGFAPDFPRSGSNSMSSHENSLPATPQSGLGEVTQNGQYSLPQNDFSQLNPNVQLWRTDSQAYQDELYNPPTANATVQPTSASKPANTYLSPHRNLVTERLQTANLTRSQSPTSSVSRERSPFRDHSPLAPMPNWQGAQVAGGVGTAASMRQQQKERADQAELAQHRPQLNREPTKTISPKDALLDYNEQEQPSLFQDTIPAGYKQHNGGTEQWPNNFFGQPGSAFGTLQTPSQQAYTNFRATSADGFSGSEPMGYTPLPPQDQGQLQNNPSYMPNSFSGPKMEANPEFPAHLTTMESSLSDNGPQPSSQDSIPTVPAPQRPLDTRAATGTYTCTYHGCTQRFDSHANLQKHKRDYHRSQQQHSRDNSGATSSAEASASPRSTESPAPSAAGMTSAALMARNSQAGPHKCTRINPSTNKPCNTIFSRPYDLTRHEDTIHNGRKQKVRCPMCREEKTFSRNDALTRHMRVVHPEVESFGKRQKRI